MKAYNNKFTRNNETSAKSKLGDGERESDKSVKDSANNTKSALNKENRNLDAATRMEKPALRKEFERRKDASKRSGRSRERSSRRF